MKISILIATRKRRKDLLACLRSVQRQKLPPYEVIVAENNQSKTVHKIINDFNKLNIKYYLEPKIGISNARNKAIEVASGEILAFVDDDCVLDTTWADKINTLFNSKSTLVGVIGRSLNYYKNNSIAQLEQKLSETWLSQYLKLNEIATLTSGMFINTRNFAARREVLEKYQVKFNPSVPHKIEDTDFGLRLFENLDPSKKHIVYHPEVVVYHKNSRNLFDFLRRRRLSKRGKNWLLEAYPGFEDSVPIRNPMAFLELQKKFTSVWILFFLERQVIRLQRVFGAST